jgi:hypothetical protein
LFTVARIDGQGYAFDDDGMCAHPDGEGFTWGRA